MVFERHAQFPGNQRAWPLSGGAPFAMASAPSICVVIRMCLFLGPADCARRIGPSVCSRLRRCFPRDILSLKAPGTSLALLRQSDPAAVRMEAVAAVYRSPTERHGPVGTLRTTGEVRIGTACPVPVPSPEPAVPPTTPKSHEATVVDPAPQPVPPAATSWAWAGISHELVVNAPGDADREEDREWLGQTANAAKFALQQFQMNSKLLASTLTPNAALLKFQGNANLTVEQVLKRRSEFLTTHKLYLVSERAEPGIVSIAVARQRRRMLQVDECWQRWNPACSEGNTDLLVGVREEDGGLLLISPVRNAPHTLIAGATGSGKSVLMQNLILSMAATNTPEQLRLTLIDPKMGVDYFAFEPLPHLSEPIISDQARAMVVLSGLVDEMNRRYEVLRANRVPNVIELRKKLGAS